MGGGQLSSGGGGVDEGGVDEYWKDVETRCLPH